MAPEGLGIYFRPTKMHSSPGQIILGFERFGALISKSIAKFQDARRA